MGVPLQHAVQSRDELQAANAGRAVEMLEHGSDDERRGVRRACVESWLRRVSDCFKHGKRQCLNALRSL